MALLSRERRLPVKAVVRMVSDHCQKMVFHRDFGLFSHTKVRTDLDANTVLDKGRKTRNDPYSQRCSGTIEKKKQTK